jgi:transcriptional regulator with XRE-family HTH domain
MKLKDYLDEKGIKYKFFAQKLGVSYQHFWRLVQGKSLPSLTLVSKIKKATDNQVTFDDWLTEEDK